MLMSHPSKLKSLDSLTRAVTNWPTVSSFLKENHISRLAFLNKSVNQTLSLPLQFEVFLAKESGRKAAYKMLVKLTSEIFILITFH